MSKWVVLDRDGVINLDSSNYIKSPQEWQAIPGSLEGIARLCRNGYQVAVATNQSGLGRGLFDRRTLAQIHQKMVHAVEQQGGRLEALFYCPHAPLVDGSSPCDCRKPGVGLLRRLMQCFSLQPNELIMVGDSQRDLDAAQAAAIKPYFVRSGGKPDPRDSSIEVHDDLAALVEVLLRSNKAGSN